MASKIETVCTRNNISYGDIRKAMVTKGSRTKEDLVKDAGVCGECEGCQEHLNYMITVLCGCKEVKMKEVQDLVKAGVRSLDEIMKKTGAGTGEDCGKCQGLIDGIINQGY